MQHDEPPATGRHLSEGEISSALQDKDYCAYCGRPATRRAWEGQIRRYCLDCDRPLYDNPVPAVCALVTDRQDRVLLVRRGVAPRKGEWCLPGGYMELGETPESAALWELKEETGLSGEISGLIGLRAVPNRIYHTVLVAGYRVKAQQGEIRAGDDAMAVRWFPHDALPPIAFGSHREFIRSAIARKDGT